MRRERDERGDGARVGAGLFRIGDDIGERAVEVECHDGLFGPRQEGGEAVTAGGGGGGRQGVR